MRILFVTQNVPYPPHGGFFQRGFNLIRELSKFHDIHLLAFRHPNELSQVEAIEASRRALGAYCTEVEYFDLWAKKTTFHKLLAFFLATFRREPFSAFAHRHARLAKRIAEICQSSLVPDVVHFDTIALAPYISNCGSIPVVLTHHNVESQLMQRRASHESGWARRAYARLQSKRLRRYEIQVTSRVSVNVMVSQTDANTLLSYCPDANIEIVPNGVDTDYFSPRLSEEQQAIIFTGRMSMFANRDGIDWFLDAVWPLIRQRAPATRFIAIGKHPSRKVLDCVAKNEGVEAPGYVSDVRPWVACAAVYVVPLRVGGGTRLKVLDAMAQGKAIVSTSLGAEGLDVEDAIHMFITDDPTVFAERIVQLLRQPQTRRSLGDAARTKAVNEYAWPALGQRLSEIVLRVAEAHSE